ncbi:YggS family pyridoxal phosphate-dependent enzyme [Ferrimonas sp. SCSIO 43195]|uniref:YggS family pyridoxal phosphate-dependent enzyme n=1 Tax=Ferrimonas sp. SCSIO 43195 TaxID=2822844 RepID=UPI002074EBA3|nr:YggS family pyridoxal phosphate-dependent enzyme [Ferrimonas sp. SCSIO 43195]USD38190.1 YggS family pyridoxal phosphate-dependent enzyme [Ferrimonas sp. SCSIO 43195]
MTTIADQLSLAQQRIAQSARNSDRHPDQITLLAVSKTKPAPLLQQAYDAGQRHFGENYLQEALEKQQQLAELPIVWHFIGPIQSNKTRPIAQHFDWVHSVDRLKIAQRLSEQRPATLPPLNLCIQVNVSHEASKSGVAADELMLLAEQIHDMPNLALRGVMAIPMASDDPAHQRQQFSQVKKLFNELKSRFSGIDTLSMGMSGDLDAAIEQGSTMVRLGTAIFGARK